MQIARFALLTLMLAGRLAAAETLEVGGDFRDEFQKYLTAQAEKAWKDRARRVAALSTPKEVEVRQQFIRKWMLEAIGGFPAKTPLNAKVTGVIEREGYRVEKIVFESQPRFYVTANLYVPATGSAPYPAVLGVAGHSDTGKAISTYQYAWIGMVKRGFVVLAFDPPGQGERLEYFDPIAGKSRVGAGVPEHIMSGLQCLLTGTNIARQETWDGIRAFDYLLTRKEVDPKRIAVAGNSGGGTQAAYLAVLEPRLATAVTSCYITSWETLWAGPGPQDAEQVFPNFLRDGLDFGDFLIAFAPKPIQMTTAIKDFFPIAGARATFAEVDRVFRTADASGRAGYYEYDDPHGWSKPRREAAYRWLVKWLMHREDDGAEPPIEVAKPEDLRAAPTGQVATSYQSETVQSLNRKLAEDLYSRRQALNASAVRLREWIASTLAVRRPASLIPAELVEQLERPEYRIEKLKLVGVEGGSIPALLFVPRQAAGRTGVLWMDGAGKAASLEQIQKIVGQGETLLAFDPRGIGESGAPGTGRGYTPEYQTAMRALLIGRPMLGVQVSDALAAYQYLRSRSLVDAAKIRIAGRGDAGVIALLAGAIEPSLAAVETEGSLVSWMDVARAEGHKTRPSLFVPGVLRTFDLPDAAAAIAPRPLRLAGVRNANGSPLEAESVRNEYKAALEAYRRASASSALSIE